MTLKSTVLFYEGQALPVQLKSAALGKLSSPRNVYRKERLELLPEPSNNLGGG